MHTILELNLTRRALGIPPCGGVRFLAAMLVLAACGGDEPGGNAGDGPEVCMGPDCKDGSKDGSKDVLTMNDADMEHMRDPNGPACRFDDDCGDGVYCNGEERCAPDDADADQRGCVAPTAPPCGEDTTCDEDAGKCECPSPDMDDDGEDSIECGGTDCDDNDANRYPGNTEVCDPDDHDEDCDPTTYGVQDQDGDGEPNLECCNIDADGVEYCGTDCDDERGVVYPGNTEACDGFDNDCDRAIDEEVLITFYEDSDGDSYGSSADDAHTREGCPDDVFDAEGEEPAYKPNADDCNDGDSAINPAAGEACMDPGQVDEDCSGVFDDRPGGCDCTDGSAVPCARLGLCGTGAEQCVNGKPDGICDITPRLEECTGFGQDEDCDGFTDEAPGAGTDDGLKLNCYPDPDFDGYAELGSEATKECPVSPGNTCPVGSTPVAPISIATTDCDEDNSAVAPGIIELCSGTAGANSGIDEDCDGYVDETAGAGSDGGQRNACYVDADSDTYSPSTDGVQYFCQCPAQTTMRVPTNIGNSDCNDNSGKDYINPQGAETCSIAPEEDEDCDGYFDEAFGRGVDHSIGGRFTCFTDTDADTYAASGASSTDLCGGCPANTTSREPIGVANIDCNDSTGKGYINPQSFEVCSISPYEDEDCDGVFDEAPASSEPDSIGTRSTCYPDNDGDGYAAAGAATFDVCGACPGNATPLQPVSLATTDCDDAPDSAGISPDGTEVCGVPSVDEDCDGFSDEAPDRRLSDTISNRVECWVDLDGDGYALLGAASGPACETCPEQTTDVEPIDPTNTDCKDSGAGAGLQNPSRTEICNSLDDNCSGFIDATDDALDEPYTEVDTTFTCAGGEWTITKCPDFQLNCDPWELSDACETSSTTLSTCGNCDTTCDFSCADEACDEIVGMALGQEHTCAYTANGLATCWGRNAEGRLGDDSTTMRRRPVEVSTIANVTAIAAGSYHSCAVSGTAAYCWGNDDDGQIGSAGAGVGSPSEVPVAVSSISSVTELATGTKHTCAVHESGKVSCWGQGQYGRLADLIDAEHTVTAPGQALREVPFELINDGLMVAAGTGHTCIIKTNNDVECWGHNDKGQTGDGTSDATVTGSRPVAGMVNASRIVAGDDHTCAINAGGAYCWGDNGAKQVGKSTGANYNIPQAVSGYASGVIDIAAAGNATCALKNTGIVECWGSNYYGERGEPVAEASATKVEIDLAGVTRIWGGHSAHFCALASGQTYCWGRNRFGQLGGTSTGDTHYTPQQVQALTGQTP